MSSEPLAQASERPAGETSDSQGTTPAIETRGLAKVYHDPQRGEVEAVRGIDLVCRFGEIHGLLGPNGAGKTTTLRMLATILAPTAGTARVAGADVRTEPLEVRRRIGFLSASTGLYPRLTGREILRYFGELHGLRREPLEARIEELVEALISSGAVAAEARAGVLQAVLEREESQTTGLGSGIAVPHGLCDAVEDVIAALGIHRGGVDFQAVDGNPVHLVILLVVPPNRFQAHIRTLAGIAQLLNDASLRAQITRAPDAAAVMDILIEREEATV